MNWDDTGFLIYKNRYNENSLIAEIFTKNHGKVSGIIFGSTSKKIKSYLQLGNQLHINYNSKSVNRIGYFKTEIQKVYSPIYFDHKQKLSCISSAMNMIRLLTAEQQKNYKIFDLIENFYFLISQNEWLKRYILWELDLFKVTGYDLDLSKLATKKITNNETIYVVETSREKKIVPNFLIDENSNTKDLKTLLTGLKLVSDYLEKTILKPNNLSYPNSRLEFINTLK
ncbi:DNA repair protein RecO [Pelagibacterales bacterium SAG-MED13]|nr:DNA repair protein RecO [Pelagibacterales bacterium SAG-MED13]